MPGRSSRCSSSSWRSRRRVSGQSRGGGAGSPRMLFCVSRGRVDAGEEPGPGLSLPANRRQHCSSNMTSHHIYARVLSPGRGGAGDAKTYGGWSVGDRGGGTSSSSPSAPPPVAISTRSTAWGDPGEEPDTAAPLIYARAQTLPPAEVHGYPLPKARAGWGCRQKCMLNRQEGAGQGCRQEVRWLECGRQGRGNKFPLPVSPTPRGDIPTVHSMGRSWRRAGYGCSPDIATHGPRPREGAGEERRRHGRGGGCPAEAHGYPCEGAGGVEEAGV